MVLRGTQVYSGRRAPDGATAGTTVVGASVGERAGVGVGVNGERVTVQTHFTLRDGPSEERPM